MTVNKISNLKETSEKSDIVTSNSFKENMKIPIYFLTIITIGWFQWYALSEPGIMMVAPTLAAILIAFVYEGKQGVSLIFQR